MNIKNIAVVIISILMSGCNSGTSIAAQQEDDREVMLEACKLLKTPEKRSLCAEAVARTVRTNPVEQQKIIGTPANISSEIISFKGIPLDKPGVKEDLQKICREGAHNRSDDKCSFNKARTLIWLSYGLLSQNLAWIVLSNDDALVNVEISGSKVQMLALAEVLEARYGKPFKTTTQVENKMGTKFDKEIFVWNDSQGSRITVDSMHDKIDEGRIVIDSASSVAVKKAADKLLREAGKKNL